MLWIRRRLLPNPQASKLSLDDVLQHLLVERQIRDDLLQPRILLLELPQPLHLRRHQTRILLLPIEERCRAAPGFPAELRDGRPVLRLLDDERLLRVREPRCFHAFPLLSQPGGSMRKTLTKIGGVSGDHIT